jgi:Zn finger protein HypA/HybF involved in hydrogenase expression
MTGIYREFQNIETDRQEICFKCKKTMKVDGVFYVCPDCNLCLSKLVQDYIFSRHNR